MRQTNWQTKLNQSVVSSSQISSYAFLFCLLLLWLTATIAVFPNYRSHPIIRRTDPIYYTSPQ